MLVVARRSPLDQVRPCCSRSRSSFQLDFHSQQPASLPLLPRPIPMEGSRVKDRQVGRDSKQMRTVGPTFA